MTTRKKTRSRAKPKARKKAAPRKRSSASSKVRAKAIKIETSVKRSESEIRSRRGRDPAVGNIEVNTPREEKPSRTRNVVPWLIAGALGFLLLTSKKSAGATLPPLPKPGAPPTLPPLVPTLDASPPPLPSPPSSTHPDTSGSASWSPDGTTSNSITGYHRAKSSEVTSEIVSAARAALSGHSIGQIVYGTTASGVNYAIALEQHYHPPGGAEKPWGPHKGSSVFVAN